jgi:hypothetical protein
MISKSCAQGIVAMLAGASYAGTPGVPTSAPAKGEKAEY